MNKIDRISASDLINFATEVTESLGAPPDRARVTAKVLAAADLRGISSHGVAGGTGLRELIDRIPLNAIDPAALPDVLQKNGWAVTSMNANGGLGHPTAMEATHLAGDLAEEFGTGRVHVYDANHFGAACVYVEALLERGLAARTTCTAGSWMIPFGGNRVRLGTNPIAWGMPCGDENIIIDIATTQRAVSPAIRAVRGGFPIPPDYFKDKNGNILEGIVSYESLIEGSVLPLGGEAFGYKGSGLNILVELDNVIGGGSTRRIKSMRETPQSRVSQTFEAWRIDFLYPEKEARQRLIDTVSDIRKYGGPDMLLPGERETRQRIDAETNGIPYEDAQWEMLRSISADTGTLLPDPISP